MMDEVKMTLSIKSSSKLLSDAHGGFVRHKLVSGLITMPLRIGAN